MECGGKTEVPRETLFPVGGWGVEERTDKVTPVGLRISAAGKQDFCVLLGSYP